MRIGRKNRNLGGKERFGGEEPLLMYVRTMPARKDREISPQLGFLGMLRMQQQMGIEQAVYLEDLLVRRKLSLVPSSIGGEDGRRVMAMLVVAENVHEQTARVGIMVDQNCFDMNDVVNLMMTEQVVAVAMVVQMARKVRDLNLRGVRLADVMGDQRTFAVENRPGEEITTHIFYRNLRDYPKRSK